MTDRTLRAAADLDALAFDERGLVPVVAQETGSGAVLMVAWANRQALERALDTGFMHYWSRSRASLWKKGETSGNLQRVVSLHADCDGDTVLARVTMEGPACHTGEATCFGTVPQAEEPAREAPMTAAEAEEAAGGRSEPSPETRSQPPPETGASAILDELWGVLQARRRERPEGSYTTRLLADENLRHKKLGEETVELVSALVRGDDDAAEEAADLLYHLMVAVAGAGGRWDDVMEALRRRRR